MEDVLKTRANLVIRNLRGLENTGDASTIHHVRTLISYIINTEANMNFWAVNNADKYNSQLSEYIRFIKLAEDWLVTYAKTM